MFALHHPHPSLSDQNTGCPHHPDPWEASSTPSPVAAALGHMSHQTSVATGGSSLLPLPLNTILPPDMPGESSSSALPSRPCSCSGSGSRRRSELIPTSSGGNVFYAPRHPRPKNRSAAAAGPPSFPSPRIGPRPRRPHSIHIVSYPSGFVPAELRPLPPLPDSLDEPPRRKKRKELQQGADGQERVKREEGGKKRRKREERETEKKETSKRKKDKPPPLERSNSCVKIIGKLSGLARRLSRSERPSQAERPPPPDPMRVPSVVDAIRAPPDSVVSVRAASKNVAASSVAEVGDGVRRPVASRSGVSCSIVLAEPNVFLSGFDHDGRRRQHDSASSQHSASALLRGKLQLSVSKSVKVKAITMKLSGRARTDWPEGIPPLKVDLFEEDALRTQSLVFFHAMHEGIWETEYGNQCRYELREGAVEPRSHTSRRSHAASQRWRASMPPGHPVFSQFSVDTDPPVKQLSLQSINSRSFGKTDSPAADPVRAKGYKVFGAGTYEYSFELPIDHHQLETTRLPYGRVKWELEATVERAGAFKANLRGTREVSVIRVPDQLSLEMTEPISISRQWEDQMHYDIVISGKSFPIGGRIPLAFKLTPLAKVQLHKLKVFATESVEYWTSDRRVTRRDPGRKILLLEKVAGRPLERRFEPSELRVVSGGELSPDGREQARRAAARRANADEAVPPPPPDNILGDLDLGLETYWGSTEIEMNVQMPTCAMMARDKALRLHPDCSWRNVHVYHWIKVVLRISRPDPEDPAGKRRRHFEISIDSPFTVLNCRATQANTSLPQYSGRDRPPDTQQQHPASCGCPDAVAGSDSTSSASLLSRQDSTRVDRQAAAAAASSRPTSWVSSPLRFVQQSRASTSTAASSSSSSSNRWSASPVLQRPMELLRCPSYNPPEFDADEPPPPLDMLTPPPNYDAIVGTPSVDGLADYFARLARYEGAGAADEGSDYLTSTAAGSTETTPPAVAVDEDESDSGDEHHPARIHSGGRVNVANPRTPGGRTVPSRSLDLERPALRLSLPRRGGEAGVGG